jgi:predicted small secreted protein
MPSDPIMRRRAALSMVVAAAMLLGACGGPDGSGSPIAGSVEELPPVPAPVLSVAPICLGVPFATCRDLAESAAGSGVPGGGPPIARVTVRCKGICTLTKGEGETRIDFIDGTNQISSWGYAGSG